MIDGAAPPVPAHRRRQVLSVLTADNASRVSDLANHLGVSPMTVRRDLSELQRQGLVKRVHGGAILPPSSIGKPEHQTAVGRVAILVPNLDFDWPSVARGAETAANWRNLKLLLRSDANDGINELPALSQLFATGDVIGVGAAIDTNNPHSAEVLDWLAVQEKPFVLIETQPPAGHHKRTFETVVTDHAKGTHEAAQHLWELGHRRLGCVIRRTSPAADRIAAGWLAACDELGIPAEQTFVEVVPDHCNTQFMPAAQAVVTRCLTAGVTGLLVHSDREAIGLAEQLERRGRHVPEDISIVSYDDELAPLYSPALTAVRPAGSALGTAAVDLLVARQAAPHRPIHHVTISPELIVRESTSAPPPR